MEIKHFDHDHLLWLSNIKRDDQIQCNACFKDCVGETYICSRKSCEYSLHESCAKLPRKVQSPFHPHPLTLQRNLRYSYCHVCTKGCLAWGLIFRCDECGFFNGDEDIKLDLECALIRRVNKEIEEGDQIQGHKHFNHHHPFELVENMPNNRFECPVCGTGTFCSDPTYYACLPCRLFLHRSCFERYLPTQIQHFFHPHPLTLQSGHTTCKACYKHFAWYYSCEQCYFDMDIDCTLLPNTINIKSDTSHEFEQIHHFLHGHPLMSLKDDQKEVDCYCYVCGKSCTAPTPTYVCGRSSCDHIYFHKSCLELQQQIYHPFHPYHPLTLLEQSDERKCNACRKSSARTFKPDLRHVAYTCQSHNCRFLLHAECSVMNMMPAIKYEGHGHLLQFRDDNDKEKNKLKCRSCKYNICESYAFTCLYCNLNLHLACGPLPYIIKHKGYIDPLVLTNSPVEEEVEDETDEFYCHVCEEERDPRLPVYYSAECYFVAEIKCVISEVILLLKGEYGEVELRSTLGHSGKLIFQNEAKEMVQKKEQVKKTLTLYAILKSWSKDEIEQLNSVLKSGERTLHIAQEDDNDKDSVCQTFLVSDEAYTRFMKVLDRGAKIPEPFKTVWRATEVSSEWAPNEEVANVGGYMVIQRLAPILKHLLSKHGDISATAMVRPMVKMYLFHMLCECIYSMINTNVVDIKEDLLRNWWTSLKILQFANFEIQFAFDNLKRVVHAYFGLHIKKEVDNTLDIIDREIQALKDKRKCIITAKSNLLEECLREASILKHGKAGAFFFHK